MFRSLPSDDQETLLAYDLHMIRELDTLTESLITQKAYSAEVALRLALVRLGL